VTGTWAKTSAGVGLGSRVFVRSYAIFSVRSAIAALVCLDAAQRELPRADLELLALAAAKHLFLEPGQLGFERPDPLQEQRVFGDLLFGRQHVYS
jgi:hypothetical protein